MPVNPGGGGGGGVRPLRPLLCAAVFCGTGDALAVADRALAGGREAPPLSPLTDDRYADLLASSLRDVEASAARSSRRRGLLSSPEEAAAALDRLDHRGY